jgi:signal transduction histidine kinase
MLASPGPLKASRILIAALFAGSLLTLGLWLFAPVSVVGTLSLMMKANTSLSFVILSAALWVLISDRVPASARKGAQVAAVLVAVLGAASFAQYFVGPLGIDELVRADVPAPESMPYPGRMAPNTGLAICFMGLGVLLLDVRWFRKTYPSDLLFLCVLLMGAVALVGYLFQVTALYQISHYLRMSQYTAGGAVILCVAGLLARSENRALQLLLSPALEGYLLRRLLPFALLVPILFCWVAVEMRDQDIFNRPTTFSLLAVCLALVFSMVSWFSARMLAKTDGERRRLLEQEKTTLTTIHRVGQAFVSELELEKVVQSVTDAATQLSNAEFGAFFYNVLNAHGESYSLYTISGVPKDSFSKFPMPRNTAVFAPTFSGQGTVRSDDITQDPRYGHTAPHYGMPKGHLPVKSYLAVPVISRSGEVLGGLFFGHHQPAVFTANAEQLVEGLAAQAAIALDNARLYQKLQESIRVRDEFLSIASHELKTPLTSLLLQMDVFQRRVSAEYASPQAEPLRQNMDRQKRQLHRLARLIDDMLDLSRIGVGKVSLQRESCDLTEMLNEVVERHRPEFDSAGSKLALSAPGPTMGQWDRLRLEQVVTNLLTNAVRYGEGKPIEISLRTTNAHAVLEVRDHGMGIAKTDQERIFLRFERAVSANDVSGLGLGLYISREIVTRHGGSIRVESEPGLGSSFLVELPLRAES